MRLVALHKAVQQRLFVETQRHLFIHGNTNIFDVIIKQEIKPSFMSSST